MLDVLRDALWGLIDGFKDGWWRWRNAAMERAIIFVRQGPFIERKLGKRIFVGDLGEIFAYDEAGIAYVVKGRVTPAEIAKEMHEQTKEQAKRWRKIFEPPEYNIYDTERCLFVVDGEVVCTPIKGTGVGMDQDSLSNFNRGDAVYQATHSFRLYSKGLNIGGWKLILFVLALAAIGFVVYRYVIAPNMGHNVPTPTPTPVPYGMGVLWIP